MKNKLREIYEHNKLTIKTIITVLVIGIIVFILFQILTNNTLKEYSTDIYEIKYDRSWHISKKDNEKLNIEQEIFIIAEDIKEKIGGSR